MENKKLGKKPAFPVRHLNINGQIDEQNMGMSKRFYAACAAMQGLLANSFFAESATRQVGKIDKDVVRRSFEIADELLKQENL